MLPEGVNLAHPDKLYIGGQWVPARSGRMPHELAWGEIRDERSALTAAK